MIYPPLSSVLKDGVGCFSALCVKEQDEMEQSQYNFFSFIWNIANDVLANAFNKDDYKKVILPMLVLCRIDVAKPQKGEKQ